MLNVVELNRIRVENISGAFPSGDSHNINALIVPTNTMTFLAELFYLSVLIGGGST